MSEVSAVSSPSVPALSQLVEVEVLVLKGMGELVGQGDPDIGREGGPTDEDGLLGVHVEPDDVGLGERVLRSGQVDVAVDEPEGAELAEGRLSRRGPPSTSVEGR